MNKFISLFCAISMVLATFGMASAAVISVNPLDSEELLNSVFNLTIVGDEFVDGTAGGGFGLAWNPSVLSLNSVTLTFPSAFGGDPLWDFWNEGTIDQTAGTLTGLSVASFVGTPDATFDIATLNFTAVGLGLSPIDLIEPTSNTWPNYAGTALTGPTFTDGSVNVVPIPGSLLLLGTGIVGLVGIGRKKKN